MGNGDFIQSLILAIAKVGKDHPSSPLLCRIEPFRHFLLPDGKIDYDHLDERDGACTRREVLLRFLLLNAVIDQGPDIVGVRELLIGVTNDLYRKEVRFLHRPLLFFQELGLAIDQILKNHDSVKAVRAAIWARENKSQEAKYNLFVYGELQASLRLRGISLGSSACRPLAFGERRFRGTQVYRSA